MNMAKKQVRKFEYFVITEWGDFERGIAGPFKTKAEASKLRKVVRSWDKVTACFVVRKIKG